jgi:hypothetical protein
MKHYIIKKFQNGEILVAKTNSANSGTHVALIDMRHIIYISAHQNYQDFLETIGKEAVGMHGGKDWVIYDLQHIYTTERGVIAGVFEI